MSAAAGNRLKLGLFGANCSSGRAVTKVPERWSGTWPDNLRLARMADAAGIDFMLPIGRWKGYGGETDYQGATLETITWACGLLAATRRISVFGTVHAPLFHPVIAAKQMVTADHIGEGRFGLNIVVGWNEDEFQMFGVTQREHDARYDYAQEWIDAVKTAWIAPDDADFEGQFIRLKAIRAKPKTINTKLGTFGEVLYTLAPKAVDQILHAAYKVFPDSSAAKGQKDGEDKASVEQIAMANLMKGVHW